MFPRVFNCCPCFPSARTSDNHDVGMVSSQRPQISTETQPSSISGPTMRASASSSMARPYYRITTATADQLHALRREVGPPPSKKYLGFGKINQILRHISSAVYDSGDKNNVDDLVEVQCSVFDGKIHISSNFESDRIPSLLEKALNNSQIEKRYRPTEPDNWEDVSQTREYRHTKKLQNFVALSQDAFDQYKYQLVQEIEQGSQDYILHQENASFHADPTALSARRNELKTQAVELIDTLRNALTEIRNGNYDSIMSHKPLEGGVRGEDEDSTTHAEQNIEEFVAMNANEISQNAHQKMMSLKKNGPIIIPMAGRYIPCATCNEVEHTAKTTRQSHFGQDGLVKLYRTSNRIGLSFPGEKQYLAHKTFDSNEDNAVRMGRRINDEFDKGVHGSTQSKFADRPSNIGDYDTDSESDPE